MLIVVSGSSGDLNCAFEPQEMDNVVVQLRPIAAPSVRFENSHFPKPLLRMKRPDKPVQPRNADRLAAQFRQPNRHSLTFRHKLQISTKLSQPEVIGPNLVEYTDERLEVGFFGKPDLHRGEYNVRMIWLQMLPVLAVWLGWIAWRRSNWAEGRFRYGKVPRAKRIWLSIGATVLGPAMLLGGLVLMDSAGVFSGNLSIPAMLAILVLGLAFIELQMVAVAVTGSLVYDSVTASRGTSSKMEEQEEKTP